MPALSESDLIDSGFAAQFQQIYRLFADAYDAAHANATAQQTALEHFKSGVRSARAVREAAKAKRP